MAIFGGAGGVFPPTLIGTLVGIGQGLINGMALFVNDVIEFIGNLFEDATEVSTIQEFLASFS